MRADSLLHGFVEFLDYGLYREIKISTLPSTCSPSQDMFNSVSPVYIPLSRPINLKEKDELKLHLWRNVSESKVW